MDTTRKYPRTLREAFPYEADYACAIERTPRRSRAPRWVYVLLAMLFARMAWTLIESVRMWWSTL